MKENKILKVVTYIFLPIFIFIIVMSFVYTLAKQQYNYMLNDSYFKTQEFATRYIKQLGTITDNLIYTQGMPDNYDDQTRIYNYSFDNLNLKNNYFLIIYKDKAITNVFSQSTIDEIKQYIMNQDGEQLISINGNLKSNPLNQNIENYKGWFNHVYYITTNSTAESANAELESQIAKFEDYEIYATYTKEFNLSNEEKFIVGTLQFVEPYENIIYISIPICAVLTLASIVFLIIAIGHTKGKEEVDTNDFDKIPFEIILTIAWVIIFISVMIVAHIIDYYGSSEYFKLYLSSIICLYLVIYTIFAITITTFIKRIKANTLIQTTIIGKICMLIEKLFKKIKKASNEIAISMTNAAKLVMYVAIYLTVMILVFVIFIKYVFFALLIDACITIYVFYQIIRRIKSFEMIEKHLKDIYEGNINNKLNPEDFCKEFTNTVGYINDISNGFENAIQEGIKSERLKTELITNVSHDIKTPLTSIINYVDLLKQENIENEKAREYIEILENKAHRLKRLTEDLVEASKASSGNVKLNLEKIGITELINQTTGEFEEKFKERGLEIITSFPEEETYIEADSRYMYRIIENAFSNISKYALANSRVYIDVKTNESKVNISIKNISSDKLNISEEELMQRFVRGDKSRTTEGSGLGLSIAKSLTELQKGKFNIRIDGDLFKIELEFDKI